MCSVRVHPGVFDEDGHARVLIRLTAANQNGCAIARSGADGSPTRCALAVHEPSWTSIQHTRHCLGQAAYSASARPRLIPPSFDLLPAPPSWIAGLRLLRADRCRLAVRRRNASWDP